MPTPQPPVPKKVVGAKHDDYGRLVMRWDPFTAKFVLDEPFLTPEYVIPTGTATDGASRPEFAELLGVKRYDRSLYACVVHDWMYANAIATKKQADDLFELNLIRCHELYGFPYELIAPMVAAVRIGGKGAYK